jgi:hypothetical protein
MKKIVFAVMLGVATLMVFSSCSKDDLSDPKKPEIQCPKDTVQVAKSCDTVVVEDLVFQLSDCVIYDTVTYGDQKNIETISIVPNNPDFSYQFHTYGYGEGFPSYAILGGRSGAGKGVYQLTSLVVNSEVFDGPGDYLGVLPIKLERSGVQETLNLTIHLNIQ